MRGDSICTWVEPSVLDSAAAAGGGVVSVADRGEVASQMHFLHLWSFLPWSGINISPNLSSQWTLLTVGVQMSDYGFLQFVDIRGRAIAECGDHHQQTILSLLN